MKVFECMVGSEYRFNPCNPTVRLRIDENLGHNSIKTTCMDCGKVDTYAKSDLEAGKVYLCKHCGKNAVYRNGEADLKILKVFEHEKHGLVVEFSCNKCKKHILHKLENVIYGKVNKCKHCAEDDVSIRKGDTFGRYEVTQVGTLKSGKKGAELTCKKCGVKHTKETDYFKLVLKSGKNIDDCLDCKCNYIIDIERLNKNTNFKNITESRNNNSEDCYAECTNCGYKAVYKRKHILDGGRCKACNNKLKIGTKIQIKKDVNKSLKYKLTDKGREHLESINNTYTLTVDDFDTYTQDFANYIKNRNTRRQSKLHLKCKCNNCNTSTRYEFDSIEGIASDIKKCQVCDFEAPLGALVGSGRDKMEITGFDYDSINKRAFINLKCPTCGVEKKISKLDLRHFTGCEICETQRKYGLNKSNKVIGNIHKIERSSTLDSRFKRIGQYIVYGETINNGKISAKGRCCQCGFNDDKDFDTREELRRYYESTSCEKCNYLMKETKNYINNNNWVGYIKNSHIIRDVIDNGEFKTASVECLLCHKIKNVPLTLFLSSERFICEDCLDTKVLISCPLCHGIHQDGITLRQLYAQDESYINCPVKNEKVAISKFRLAHEMQSKLDYFFENYDLGEIEEVAGNSDLIRSKDKFYIGTDGEKYYTCYCKKHNKLMTLREDELMKYDHAYCADTRMFGYL